MQIADLLREQFRIDSIFRIDSEVFEIVIPDIDYETFINRFNLTINNINQLRKGLVSTGHTWTDTDIDIDKLINHAEELMIINKDSKNAAEIFDAQDEHLANLNDALNRNWFTFFLQPKVDLKTNKVSCSESLVRMVHPTYGVISPAKIIPILEKNKMVSVVDFYVLELVCQTLKRWKDEGRVLLPISVNYSRVTLLENDIVERTKDVIEKYGVDKSLIEIEITETIGNMEQKKISEIAEKFIAAGVNLAIDDFGSKYSSLSTLSTVPFNVVKVDKSIINDLVINPRSQIIVEQIINICKQLNMKSVAEGIETERQWKEVKRLGFDLGQGYFFEKPISIKEFEEKFMKVMK
jgi:EAL domain-containing protein (putative c-di-GMP-specific phosphodiesterase class I)